MTQLQLLVSVRSAAEALAALAGGADWIDLKEPQRGPLGAVDADVAREVVAYVAGRAPISAAAGELVDWPHSPSRELLEVDGISHLKLGLAGCRDADWQSLWREAQTAIVAAGKQLVAVIYADQIAARSPSPAEVIALAAEKDSRWVLVDTFDKLAGSLGDYFQPNELLDLLRAVRRQGRATVLAGSLRRDSIAALPIAWVDVVAVRGAACRGHRQGPLCRDQVSSLHHLVMTLNHPIAQTTNI